MSVSPLRSLPRLAERIGVAELLVKDESLRSDLGAFKSVGVEYALDRLQLPSSTTLVCASAGNHGRAVARGGARRGMRVRVYVGASATAAARAAIAAEGAEVIAVDGTYEDAVSRARADRGGVMISDVAAPGDERVPRLIMDGYRRIMDEAREQWSAPPDAIVVQAGVGSLAAAVVEWAREHLAEAPTIVCRPADPSNTIMAGLACTELSSLAAPILGDEFVRVTDDDARAAMIALAEEGVVAGASGAAGVAAAMTTRMPSSARVLAIVTEGATDAALYESIVRPHLNELRAELAETPGRINVTQANVWDICHLRDIEREAYAVRIRRILRAGDSSPSSRLGMTQATVIPSAAGNPLHGVRDESEPFLPDVDGDALAAARRYLEDDAVRAHEAFAAARAETLALLDRADLTRGGVLEGVGRVTVVALAARLLEHDREHLAMMNAV